MKSQELIINPPLNAEQILNIVAIDTQALQDFLKFQGRCFKQPLHTTLAFFGQNPNAEMIQEKSVWERFGCTPKEGAKPVLVERNDGTFAEFYDYSQMNGNRPPIWTATENGLTYIKQRYKIANKFDFGDVLKSLAKRDSFVNADLCADTIKIDKKDFFSFRSLYNSAVTTALAGRFELGSNFKYTAKLNDSEINLFNKINAHNENFGHFLTSVTATVNKILFDVEKDLKEVNHQNERNSQSEIRTKVAGVYGNELPDTSGIAENSEQISQPIATNSLTSTETIQDIDTAIRETEPQTISEFSENGALGENETRDLRQSSDEGNRSEIRNSVIADSNEKLSIFDLINFKEEQVKALRREITKLKKEQKEQFGEIAENQTKSQKTIKTNSKEKAENSKPKTPKKRGRKVYVNENQLSLFDDFANAETENKAENTVEKAQADIFKNNTEIENTAPKKAEYDLDFKYINDRFIAFNRANYDEENDFLPEIIARLKPGEELEILDENMPNSVRLEIMRVAETELENLQKQVEEEMQNIFDLANSLNETSEISLENEKPKSQKRTQKPKTPKAEKEQENIQNTLFGLEEENSENVEINEIENAENSEISEEIENTKSQKTTIIDNSANYKITDENLGVGGEKTKFRYNIEAIELLKKLEIEDRIATPEEQEILAKYVGFGAISNVFNESKDDWKTERERLKQAVSEEEYRGLAGSTLNAHYTSPTVIEAIYTACENFGIPQNAKILEPAMGVGNFFGKLPESMKNAKLFGVELDPITSKIAQKLYPSARIENCGFEKTNLKNDSIDLAIGNVPFGSYTIRDPEHKNDWLIHDAFFRKSVDKVAPGGIVAFITSKGTLDKKSDEVRKYLAERADFIGAIRLPNTAFKANAGTEVTSDIIFLQKRETPIDISTKTPDWCFVGRTEDGVPCNQYFLQNPHMVLGKMSFDNRMYGNNTETACVPFEGADLKEQLSQAISKLSATFAVSKEKAFDEPENDTLQAPLNMKNFTICSMGKDFYFKNGSELFKMNVAESKKDRLRGILGVREAVRNLIDVQVNGCNDEILTDFQSKLNSVYNRFTAKYGALSEKINRDLFVEDDDIHLVMSLEQVNKTTKEIEKADIFYKRTISAEEEITSCENVEEAFFVSMDRKGFVDLEFIGKLCDLSPENARNQLIEIDKIYLDPVTEKYIESAEYLSGNVREKLKFAETAMKENPDFKRNIEALQRLIPPPINASEISVRLGASWIKLDDYARFLNEVCGARFTKTFENEEIPKHSYGVQLQKTASGEFKIKNANSDYSSRSVEMTSTFGTARMNAYQIFENLLNQRDCVIRDNKKDEHGYDVLNKFGKPVKVVNFKETQKVQEKARILNEKFVEWLWKNSERRENYVKIYNEKFNNLVGREYDGSRQNLTGMSPLITLRPHQLNAIARAKYGGNSLFAHVVGAGKSFELIATVMEKKRLGLINKAAIVVPKALTTQTAIEWQRLYPNAKLLVATEKDFTKENRNKFMARLTTGSYDGVILSQEQFEKIPVSLERQTAFIRNEIEKIADTMAESDDKMTVKRLEKKKKVLEGKLEKMLTSKKRDTAIEFEQTGIDMIVVDESHMYKNGLIVTKMANVSGIGGNAAQKCEDMLMKTQYLNEKFGYKNILFCTGTAISNSMSELYTITQYLRPDLLEKSGIKSFDDWCCNFAKVNTQLEMSPSGGYKPKKRLNEFVNLPELMQIFHTFSDVKNAEDLDLPTPELETGKPITVLAQPSEFQLKYIQELAERAREISTGRVDPRDDNLLKITHEARLLGLDGRCIYPDIENIPDSKVNLCVDNLMKIYEETAEQKGVQAVFSDIAVHSDEGRFSVYEYIKNELIARGVPENEICFASDAQTPEQRKALFSQINSGEKRFVIASTQKLGTGSNVQERLKAVHHLDIPWVPSSLEQRNGRILRQGNTFEKVKIFNYLTEKTFDSYLMGIIVNKSKFINQLMSGKNPGRQCSDLGETVLNYAEMQALASADSI